MKNIFKLIKHEDFDKKILLVIRTCSTIIRVRGLGFSKVRVLVLCCWAKKKLIQRTFQLASYA